MSSLQPCPQGCLDLHSTASLRQDNAPLRWNNVPSGSIISIIEYLERRCSCCQPHDDFQGTVELGDSHSSGIANP